MRVFLALLALLALTMTHQNCDSANLDPASKKRNLSSEFDDGITGGSTGRTTGATNPGAPPPGAPQTPVTQTPANEAEEDVIECGSWTCPGGDYSCAPGLTDEEWHEVFLEMLQTYQVGPYATVEGLERIEESMEALGVLFQRNSANELRGRIYLPSYDYCARWERAFDVVQGIGWGDPWGWTPRGNIHW